MEFRKMVTITLHARQQKRHRCIEQSFGLCVRGRRWDDLGEYHGNMYNIIKEMNRQFRFDTGSLGLVHWDDPDEWYREGSGRGCSGLGTRVHPWQIHVDVWQNQYNIVK